MLAAIGVTAADVFIKPFLRVIHMRFQKITGLQNCGSLGELAEKFFLAKLLPGDHQLLS